MVKFHQRRAASFLISIALLIAIAVVCSKDVNKPEPTPTFRNLVVTILSPSSDTTVAAADTSIAVSGTIGDPDLVGVDTFLINGIGSMSMLTDSDTKFSGSIKLTGDTTKVVIVAASLKGYAGADTITIYRAIASGPAKTGLATISGKLTKEGSSLGKIRRVASNAAGQAYYTYNNVVPVSGADILVYDADTTSTSSVAHTRSDTAGLWNVDSLPPGNYFAFAVYFDIMNKSVITAAIQNITAVADSVINTGEAVAAEDEVKPTVLSMLDATSGDSTGLFLATKVPAGKPILTINFSEPMDRTLAGDSIKGVVLGPIDTSGSSFSLADTIPVEKMWNGNGTELRLVPRIDLKANLAYGIVVPTALKDLAFNPLQMKAMVSFTTVPLDSIAPFTFAGSVPGPNDTIQSSSPIIISFSRSPDVISVSKRVTFDPAIKGFFEVRGTAAIFKPESLLLAGKYVVTIPAGVKSMLGDSLGKVATVSFSVKQLTGLAVSAGDTGLLAQTILKGLNGYQGGDLAAFSDIFDASMMIINHWKEPDGQTGSNVQSKEEFIRQISRDKAFESVAREKGVLFPAWYMRASDSTLLYKVKAREDTASFIFVEAMNGGAFGPPRLFKSDRSSEIPASELQFVPGRPEVVYGGKHYAFAPDLSTLGPISQEQIENNPAFHGEMYARYSTVQVGTARLATTEDMNVQSVTIVADTGVATISMKSVRIWSGVTRPWPYVDGKSLDGQGKQDSDTTSEVMAIKMKCVKKSGRWLVVRMVAETVHRSATLIIPPSAFDQSNFAYTDQTFALPPSAALISPVNKAENASSNGLVTLKWTKPSNDSLVKGYLVGIAEDPQFTPCRPPRGALIFVPRNSLSIGLRTDGTVDTSGGVSAMVINKRPNEMDAHMMPWYDMLLDKIAGGMVFQWKVLALRDSSARDLIANRLQSNNIVAQSDFAAAKGAFAVTIFPTPAQIDSMCKAQGPGMVGTVNGFEDSDGDGTPNQEEIRWGTDPKNPSDYPRFEVDSDGDKIADFLEIRFTTNPNDPNSKPTLEQLATVGYKDSDGDGFPDEVEARLGTNMFDPKNNPGTRVAFESPVGSFSGKLFFGSQSMPVTVMVSKDTAGTEKDFRVIYQIPSNAVEDTIDTVKAIFDKYTGEIQFLVELDRQGSEAGKALKMRGGFDPMMGRLGGPVDIIRAADGLAGNGPKVGDWTSSNRGESFNAPPPTGPTGGFVPPQMPPNADVVWLVVSKGADGAVAGKMVYSTNLSDTTGTLKGMKSGSIDELSFLSLVFKKKASIMHLNGNQMRVNGDTVGWYGGIMLEDTLYKPLPFGGGFGFVKADAVPNQWPGIYKGWIFVDTTMSGGSGGTGFGGPPEYIGGIDLLLKQLQTRYGTIATGDTIRVVSPAAMQSPKSVVFDTSRNILSVAKLPAYTFLNPGCVFAVTTAGDTLLIFGTPDDRMIVDVVGLPDGSKAIIAELPPPAGGKTPSTPGPNVGGPYTGDSSKVAEAIAKAGNVVWLQTPNGLVTEMVNPASLRRKPDQMDPNKAIFVVSKAGDSLRQFIILASATNPDMIALNNDGKPIVMEGSGGTGPGTGGPSIGGPYTGDSSKVAAALANAGNVVWVKTPNGLVTEMVNPASLRRKPDQMDPNKAIFVVSKAGDSLKQFVILASGTSPDMLALNNDGKPIVMEASGGTGPGTGGLSIGGPYMGDSSKVAAALASAGNAVWLQTSTGLVTEMVDPASLRRKPDPMDPNRATYVVNKAGDPLKQFVILASGTSPDMLALNNDGKPIVMAASGGTGGTGQLSGGPYMGDSLAIASLLASANYQVWVQSATGMMIENADPASLKRQPDKMDSTKLIWTVRKSGDTSRVFIIQASGSDPNLPAKNSDGKPIAMEAGRTTVPPTGSDTLAPPAFSGDSTMVATALVGAANKVRVLSPDKDTIVVVDPNSLHKVVDPQGNVRWVIALASDLQKQLIFVGTKTDPHVLMITEGNLPAVMPFMKTEPAL